MHTVQIRSKTAHQQEFEQKRRRQSKVSVFPEATFDCNRMNSEHALKGLVVAIKKTLEEEHEAHVPGLGLFRLVEKPSRLDLGTDGRTRVTPPVRTVTFSPNPTESA